MTAAVTALALLLAGCSGATPAATAPPATSVPTATAEPPATSAAPDVTPISDAGTSAPGVATYPVDTRTGVDVVDRVIEAVLSEDGAALAALADFRERPCTVERQGMGVLVCPDGVADGSPLPVIQLAFCEGMWGVKEAIPGAAEGFFRHGLAGEVDPLRLYAVASIAGDPTLAGSRYRLLFAFPDGVGRQAWASDVGVTMLWWGCGDVPVSQMTTLSKAEPVPDYLLAPLAE